MRLKQASVQPLRQSGILLPVGGAEDRTGERVILRRFVELCGGNAGKIVVLPCASAFAAQTGQLYCDTFTALGIGSVVCLDVRQREGALDPRQTALLDGATGIFMSGGDQAKLLSLIGGTPVASAITAAVAAGVHIAGTSAGASAMSRQMIACGGDGLEPAHPVVQVMPGLGLTPLVIDQHFAQRRRLHRLQTAVAMTPAAGGIGIDENTALLLWPNGECEVIGAGAVTVVETFQPAQRVAVFSSGERFFLPAATMITESAAD